MKPVSISENEMNYLKDDGNYLLDEHVYMCFIFKEGFGKILYNDGTYNLVDTSGKLLLKNNVTECRNFENGFSLIIINDTGYSIDTKCSFYSYPIKVSFKQLYNVYPNMKSELIEIINKYTYFNVIDYFNI